MKMLAGLAAVALLAAPALAETKPFALSSPAPAIVLAPKDFDVVRIAAKMFAEDVGRVTGTALSVFDKAPAQGTIILAGTLGHSPLVDKLVVEGRLPEAAKIKGRWETTLTQIVDKPFPGIERALVIAGSDRRGTSYGLMRLSEKIGVSPWVWWADAPVLKRANPEIACASPEIESPAVKYRGIFINDEDWGLYPWAKSTFDPELGNIGPKTYEKVFQLLLRLRLNYLWPAMHGCSTEFAAIPENAKLAHRYGIVAGSSHCEPMLCNNVKWDTKTKGPWDYSTNRATIVSYWEESAKTRGGMEAVWTLGLRGIHDQGMKGPKDMPGRIALLDQVFADQLAILKKYASADGSPAMCFVPYKEVLPIFDAGLKVPEDATLVWVDDNFGYIRRLSSPEERKRPGGAGIYWHLSYYGSPHSYTWINSTPPAHIWEELGKAWAADARMLWVINVGDIKPAEIGIDFFSRFAWDPDAFGPDFQPAFLREFAARNIGEKVAPQIADLLGRFYRLGSVRKPELMERAWALALSDREAVQLAKEYAGLLSDEKTIAAEVAPDARDAYEELVGFPVKILASTGLIFMADRNAVQGHDKDANEKEIARLRQFIDEQVARYNTAVAGGKWRGMMPGATNEEKRLPRWNSQVRWPWGETNAATPAPPAPDIAWRDAASADRRSGGAEDGSRWETVEGLGPSGRAVALRPGEVIETPWPPGDKDAPSLEYDFGGAAGDAEALLSFLPTFRLYPGMQLRVAVSIDGGPWQAYEIPGSSGREDENGSVRALAVQNNSSVLRVPLPGLKPGTHTLRVNAMDPGAVLDRVALPEPKF